MTAVFVILAIFVLAALPSVLYLSVSKRRSPVTVSLLAGVPLVLALCAATFVYSQGSESAEWTWYGVWMYIRIIRVPFLVFVVVPTVLYLSVSRRKHRVRHERQKPALGVGRISGEILAGVATGFAVAAGVVSEILIATADQLTGCFGGFWGLAIILYAFPILYGPASAVGVYLVGGRGKQTGSFLLTLGGGSLGGLVMILMFPLAYLDSDLLTRAERTILLALVLLTGPAVATLSFNLTRRYKRNENDRIEQHSA